MPRLERLAAAAKRSSDRSPPWACFHRGADPSKLRDTVIAPGEVHEGRRRRRLLPRGHRSHRGRRWNDRDASLLVAADEQAEPSIQDERGKFATVAPTSLRGPPGRAQVVTGKQFGPVTTADKCR